MERCIESILAQDVGDLELVINDNNNSDDGTIETLGAYARGDTRVSLNLNQVNIGVHENMNSVLRRSRGTAFLQVDQRRRLARAELPFNVLARFGQQLRRDRFNHGVHNSYARWRHEARELSR